MHGIIEFKKRKSPQALCHSVLHAHSLIRSFTQSTFMVYSVSPPCREKEELHKKMESQADSQVGSFGVEAALPMFPSHSSASLY